MALLYKSDPVRGARWKELFAQHAPDIEFRQWPDMGDPDEIRYLLAWMPPENIMACLPSLEVLFATSAGVDQFEFDALPPELPVVRMLDPAIERGMIEYATFATLWLHRRMGDYARQQREGQWQAHMLVPTEKRRIGILGLGQLGCAIATHLAGYGFDVSGWARSPRELANVHCHSGEEALDGFLASSDIVICVLPLTDATRGILNADLFARMPKGAALINIGRGEHLVEHDLTQALDDGQLSAAVLDVLSEEPPADDHLFWQDERILLTPHVAAMTQPDSAFPVLLDNLRRHQRGEPMVGRVDLQRGY
ncbi:glyoxylate/hydroxypyruvate reductase A [Halomonas sp. QX-2]|jgi:glyoxylate/hydroxypyruvate reductase A|uniref:Glyoxylate/hydroxypyruvate reductase A n=1 Tax=Vreelandella sedimenti TaxID=2729618 RepID=A0A7Z0N3I5_9GAMM|nr:MULTISPECIES: glyoxylate/hydroxypyruvate reductase A [Halomonas]NYT70952.1 glyoxylate/hydroxypyruvate reductase A [Halomonas sedimenti]|tara:strand:- start:18857 stop:19783 length:927 start_codon:yes stop_codon:yes gene_type:complete